MLELAFDDTFVQSYHLELYHKPIQEFCMIKTSQRELIMMCIIIIDSMLKALKHTHIIAYCRLILFYSRLILGIVDLHISIVDQLFVLKDPNSLFVTVSRLNSIYSRLIDLCSRLVSVSRNLSFDFNLTQSTWSFLQSTNLEKFAYPSRLTPYLKSTNGSF